MKVRFVRPEKHHDTGDIMDIEPHLAELYLSRGVVEIVGDGTKAIHEPPRDKAVRRAATRG